MPFMADIQSMFYQVRVHEKDQRYLGFFWWPNGDFTQPMREYQMQVHVFGATSSPGCVNFALRKTAEDNEDRYGIDAANTLRHNFYVDATDDATVNR